MKGHQFSQIWLSLSFAFNFSSQRTSYFIWVCHKNAQRKLNCHFYVFFWLTLLVNPIHMNIRRDSTSNYVKICKVWSFWRKNSNDFLDFLFYFSCLKNQIRFARILKTFFLKIFVHCVKKYFEDFTTQWNMKTLMRLLILALLVMMTFSSPK